MKPRLIIIDGPMGSGKSTISKILQAKIKNCALLSIDTIKKFIYDFHNINDEKKKIVKYKITSLISKEYLKNRIYVIIEKSLGDKDAINKIIKSARPKEVPVLVIKINAPLKIRIERVSKRDKSNEKKKLLSKILQDNKAFEKSNYKYDLEFDSSKETLQTIVKKIIKRIK